MKNHKIGQERALGVIVADSSKKSLFLRGFVHQTSPFESCLDTSSRYLVAVSRPVARFCLATVNKIKDKSPMYLHGHACAYMCIRVHACTSIYLYLHLCSCMHMHLYPWVCMYNNTYACAEPSPRQRRSESEPSPRQRRSESDVKAGGRLERPHRR